MQHKYKVLTGTVVHGDKQHVTAKDSDPHVMLDEKEGDKLVAQGILEKVKAEEAEEHHAGGRRK